MVNVLHVFILLISCVFIYSQNIGLQNYSELLNYEIEDIQLVDTTICPQPPPCFQPLKYDVQYRCRSDVNCPRGFKCCIGECFILHKVCVQPYHVKKLQFFGPPAKNASLPKTLLFDNFNATLLDDIKVKLSENFIKILANESGHLIFSSSGSLISLATILPLLKTTSLDDSEVLLAENYSDVLTTEVIPKDDLGYNIPISFNKTQFKETKKEYDQSSEQIIGNYEIFEPKPLTQNYESTETVNNDFINIDDAIIERNLESDKEAFHNEDSWTTTIRTTDAESNHNFIAKERNDNKNHKQIKSTPIKGIKLPAIQNIKSIRSNIGGFEDDTDYFDGSGDDDGIVTSTPYFIKKEYDGSGNNNIETDEKGSGDNEETTSSVIFSTGTNFLEKEHNGAQNNKETDEESKYKVGIGNNEETHTISTLISSTGKNYVGKEYDRTEDHKKETTEQTTSEIGNSDKDETNTLSSVISSTVKGVENNVYNKQENNLLKNIKKSVIKQINRATKTYNGLEDDVDYPEGSGGDEYGVGSGDFLKENEKVNIIHLVKLMNDNKLFRHAAHYWKQFRRFRDDEVEGSGSSDDVKLSSQTTASTISFTKEYSDFSSDVNEFHGYTSSISSITEDADSSSLFTFNIPQVSKHKQFTNLEDDYYYDLQDDDTTTITNEIPLTTISWISTKSRLEDSSTNTYLIDNDHDSSASKTTVTTDIIHSTTTLEGSGNSDDEMTSSGDDYYYDYNFSEPLENSSSEINRTIQSPISSNSTLLDQNQIIDSINPFKEYTASNTFAGKESAKEYALPPKNFESSTENILKFTKINEKEIQKESSLPNSLFKNDKEQSFKKSDSSQDISVAKAALDMMKESTGNEPDDYYEDGNQIMF